jgi:hypothetical protein
LSHLCRGGLAILDHDADTIRTKVVSPDPRAVTQHDAECAAAVPDDAPRVVLVQPYHFACEKWRSSDGFGGWLYASERWSWPGLVDT